MTTIDRNLFEWIHQQATHPLLDQVMPILREGQNWIPLYALLLAWAIFQYRKRVVYWLLGLLLTVALTDGIGNYGFKKTFERPRPCHEVSGLEVRPLVECGSGYSFTSNHAANHMGMALYIGLSLFSGNVLAISLLILWALSIGYAQIYVGVHYPFDVLAGFMLGGIVSIITLFAYRKMYKWDPFYR